MHEIVAGTGPCVRLTIGAVGGCARVDQDNFGLPYVYGKGFVQEGENPCYTVVKQDVPLSILFHYTIRPDFMVRI